MQTRADIARKLEALEALAKGSPYPGERKLALEKCAELRAMLGAKPKPKPRTMRAPSRPSTPGRQHVGDRFVDVGDASDIKEAFKMAFRAAFDDIRDDMKRTGTWKPKPPPEEPKSRVRAKETVDKMGFRVRIYDW